ncbi:amino acid adenylation domain-containing protein, partial [Actinophytocola sp.]|uniref:amino acid adenylation domain-containing protein n=1 Tax=Actinophytocola sp. TaxID=1872138 RepID=UPI003D6B8F39
MNLPGLVLDQAARTPDAVAVRQWDRTLTYAELAGGAARLANTLRGRGVGPESTVGVCVRRTPELVVAVLGVLMSGGAYVPLDPDAPVRRREAVLRDAGATVVVTEAMITTTDPAGEVHAGPGGPDDAAYVMYTSGSTGRPKGVVVSHRSVVSWVTAFAAATGADGMAAGCRSFGFAALGFDASVLDMFVPLSLGGEIELLTEADRTDPARLQRFVERHEVTWGFVTPALLPLLDPERLPAWRCVIVGGEPPWPEQVARWTGGTPRRFFNGYGPTETTVIVCLFEATGHWDRPLPLGRPIAGHRLHVVDADLRPVPDGVPGELLIGGPGLARGYLGDPVRTADRFIPDPVGPPGARVYRTGDLVVRDPDGTLTYVGRTDRQVKLRGQRTEPGEVETVLLAHPGVRHAVVDAVPGPDGPELVAFVVADGTDDTEIRGWCAQRLPSFMVPRVVRLATFPLSATGKVDLARLRELAAPAELNGQATDRITTAWCVALGVTTARPDDDFFASGGHSIAAMRLVAALRAELGREVTIEDVFDGRTLRRVAERAALAPRLETELPTGSTPALSAPQRRLWFLDQLAPESTAYHVALSERLRGPLDVPALRFALTAVARRHDVLRWRIVEADGLPEAVVDPPGEVPLPVTDLAALPPVEREAALHAALDAEAAAKIDLARGPLWRARLIRVGTDDHVLAITVHHIVFDGWSQAPFYTDLARAYAGRGELTALSSTFADYVTWRAERDRGRAEQDLRWWTRHLEDAPTVLELPRDRPRPRVQTYTGSTAHSTVDSVVTGSVTELAGHLATTPSTVLLAAFGELLRRLTGRRDLVIGTPAADRRHLAFHDLVGFFVEIVPLRLRPDPDAGFAEAVRACRDVVLDALAHPATPLERIVDTLAAERDPSRAPLVQVLFNVYNFPEPRLELAGLSTEPIRPRLPGSPFDLTVYVVRRGAEFAVDVLYNPDLFDAARIKALLAAYAELIAELVREPSRPVRTAPMRRLADGVTATP